MMKSIDGYFDAVKALDANILYLIKIFINPKTPIEAGWLSSWNFKVSLKFTLCFQQAAQFGDQSLSFKA